MSKDTSRQQDGTRAGFSAFCFQGPALVWSLILLFSVLITAAPASSQSRASTEAGGAQTSAAREGMEDHGIKIRNPRKNVLFGSVRRCKTPAVVDYKKALAATPEARKIKDEGINKSSAQYAILKQKAVKRLKKVIRAIAVQEGRDCVVKKGCIRSKGKDVDLGDLTAEVVRKLEAAKLD